MEKLRLFTVCMAALALAACSEKESVTPEIENENTATTDGSAFTMTVKYPFKGLSTKDAVYGDFMILYCESGPQSTSVFESWKNGNDKPECQIQRKGVASSNGSFEATIENLKPDTDYDYSVCFKSEDGERREMSKPATFHTGKFNPVFNDIETSNIGFQTVTVQSQLSGILEKDLKYCSFGYVVSTENSAIPNKDNSLAVTLKDSLVIASFANLKHNTAFHCRPYVRIEPTGSYVYGTEVSFATKNFDDMKVDLGLPSGIQWAGCNLDAESMYASGNYYTWGYTKPNFLLEYSSDSWCYKEGEGYVNFGDFAGTEHDAAHVRLGGHWRMPTKADMEELLNCCQTKNYSIDNMFVAEFKAENGNYIRVPFTGYMFDGGKGDYFENGRAWYSSNGEKYEETWLALIIPTSTQYESVIDMGDGYTYYNYSRHWEYVVAYRDYQTGILDEVYITIGDTSYEAPALGLFPDGYSNRCVPIRPVWDPNM